MYRAIVVDDEPYTREGMRILIDWGSAGFQLVGEATDSESAERLIEETNPHLVFLDVQMPGLDGTQVASLIREKYPDILIAFLSGYSRFEYARAAIEVQAFCYLLKPIDPEEIERELRAASALMKVRAQKRVELPTEKPAFAPSPPENPIIAAMREYIRAEYAREPSLKDLARSLNLHQGYLGQQIKRLSGQSFLQHLNLARIEQAKLLLSSTERSVKDIAISVGIPDVDYFSQQFKRATGQTPGQYRKPPEG